MKNFLPRTLMISVVAMLAVILAATLMIAMVAFSVIGVIALPCACVYAFAKASTNRREGLRMLEEISENAFCWFASPPVVFTEIFEWLIKVTTKDQIEQNIQEEKP